MTETRVPYWLQRNSDETAFGERVEALSERESKRRQARLKIRQGLRLVLAGFEELEGLPKSFETKRGRNRDKEAGGA